MSVLRTLGRMADRHAQQRRMGSNILARLSHRYLLNYQNTATDATINGESDILERIKMLPVDVAFDVGANIGEWSRLMLDCCGQVHIHAFEIVPSLNLALAQRFTNNPRVTVNLFGLSHYDGTAIVRINRDEDKVATVFVDSEFFRSNNEENISANVRTGWSYCRDHSIDRIDFLKIDTEGNDFNVIEGFGDMIPDSVGLIQFEYNVFAIEARRYLRDFYCKLLDYDIGRVLPRGVLFKNWHHWDENFLQGNYIAVRRDNVSYKDLLRWRG